MPSAPVQYVSAEIKVGYTVTGIQETVRMLETLPKEIVLGGFNAAFQKVGVFWRDELARVAPYRVREEGIGAALGGGVWKRRAYTPTAGVGGEPGFITIHLREAAMYGVVLDSNYRGGYVSAGYGGMGHVANWLEYGWDLTSHYAHHEQYTDKRGRTRVKRSGGHQVIKHIPARPFIRPMFDATSDEAIEIFARSLAETVNRWNKGEWSVGRAA